MNPNPTYKPNRNHEARESTGHNQEGPKKTNPKKLIFVICPCDYSSGLRG